MSHRLIGDNNNTAVVHYDIYLGTKPSNGFALASKRMLQISDYTKGKYDTAQDREIMVNPYCGSMSKAYTWKTAPFYHGIPIVPSVPES